MIPVDIRGDGLLWAINSVIFHPRGFALGYSPTSGGFYLLGDGSEPWRYASDADVAATGGDPAGVVDVDEAFTQFETLLHRARELNQHQCNTEPAQ